MFEGKHPIFLIPFFVPPYYKVTQGLDVFQNVNLMAENQGSRNRRIEDKSILPQIGKSNYWKNNRKTDKGMDRQIEIK